MDEEARDITPTTPTTTYRAYHSSDEASDPGGYELSKRVQPQQQLATNQGTDTHLVNQEPEGVAEVEPLDTDDSDEEIELSKEERLRLQQEMEWREQHLKNWARIRRRAERKAKKGASS